MLNFKPIVQNVSPDQATHRRLLGIAGAVYLTWWFLVRLALPQAFNPLGSRLAVVLVIFGSFVATCFYERVARLARPLMLVACWLITAHYYYLFWNNGPDINWIIGCYITVIAINWCMPSARSLGAYSFFVVVLSAWIDVSMRGLQDSVFCYGMGTVVLQANLALRSRLNGMQKLESSNVRFQTLFDATFEGILVHDNLRILHVNRAFSELVGRPLETLVGTSVLDLIHFDDHSEVLKRAETREATAMETHLFSSNKEFVAVEMRGKDFVYEGRPARLVAVQTIGHRIKAEQDRVKALTLTENLRARDEFISLASHEFKTPLTSLQLRSQLMVRELKKPTGLSPEKGKLFVELVDRQVRRLVWLVEAMLSVSQISRGKLGLNQTRMDLAQLVRDVVAALGSGEERKGAEIEIRAPDGVWVLGDPFRLEQVIENLLTNALKYGDGERVTVLLKSERDCALLSVKNSGGGIAPADHERIFHRFERAVTESNLNGLGLGLYISRQIVEAHQGRLEVESDLGQGAVFTMSLPLST